MTIATTAPRSRRALLGAALGAAAATAAAAIGRPLSARAADGETVVVGGEYQADSRTAITISTAGGTAIFGGAYGGPGVHGRSTWGPGVRAEGLNEEGLFATSEKGHAVRGQSAEGHGVLGESDKQIGVYGVSSAYEGVRGQCLTGWGVYGLSSSGQGVRGESGEIGVIGISPKVGVFGDSTAGGTASQGVHGSSTSGRGVFGEATTGYGVRGHATTGTAGYFASADPAKGYALRAIGRVRLDKCSGVAMIVASTKSVGVTPGIDLVSTSAVVATLQGNPGGTTTVQRVAVDTATNTFKIYLTKATTVNVKVAWIVLG